VGACDTSSSLVYKYFHIYEHFRRFSKHLTFMCHKQYFNSNDCSRLTNAKGRYKKNVNKEFLMELLALRVFPAARRCCRHHRTRDADCVILTVSHVRCGLGVCDWTAYSRNCWPIREQVKLLVTKIHACVFY
jgi:hypothetical protein